MKKNMGTVDRLIRILLAICFITLYVTNIISGILGIVLIVLSVIFLLTSFISFCPIYAIFKGSTIKKKKD